MVIVSQCQNKTTESLELEIRGETTCKNTFIDETTYRRFKKIVQKCDNRLGTKELKGLGEFLEKDMTKSIYTIIERKSLKNFGTFSSKQKAKEILKNIIQAYEIGNKKYQIPQDENAKIILV